MIFWGTIIAAFILLVLPTILALVVLKRVKKLSADVTFTRRNLFEEIRVSERGIKQDTMLQAAQTNRLLQQIQATLNTSIPDSESYVLNQHIKTRTILGDTLKRLIVPVELATAAFTAETNRLKDLRNGTKVPAATEDTNKREYSYSTGTKKKKSTKK